MATRVVLYYNEFGILVAKKVYKEDKKHSGDETAICAKGQRQVLTNCPKMLTSVRHGIITKKGQKMKRINELLKMVLKIYKKITASQFARVVNGQSLKIDLVA